MYRAERRNPQGITIPGDDHHIHGKGDHRVVVGSIDAAHQNGLPHPGVDGDLGPGNAAVQSCGISPPGNPPLGGAGRVDGAVPPLWAGTGTPVTNQ